jgi:hypothetical protein
MSKHVTLSLTSIDYMKKTIIEKKNQEREVHTWGAVERSGSRSRSVER